MYTLDDPRLHDYNVEERVNDFIKYSQDQAQHYASGHVMMTFGSDFMWENARENYHNMDRLIKYVNEKQSNGSKVNIFYSTPSCYTYAINKANLTLTTKSDDFFPYASRGHTFWTGYFTSRPALKGYVRLTNNFLQVCKQLGVLARLNPADGSVAKMDVLRRALGVAQHHDAVSGTSRQIVAYDYAERMAAGIQECQDVVNLAFRKIMPKSSTPAPKQEFCQLTNVSYCSVSEQNKQFTVTVYNPVGRMISHCVRVPVSGSNYIVTGPDMTTVKSQIVPLSAATKAIPAHNGSIATGELVFAASLPPLGYKTFFVQQTEEPDEAPSKEENAPKGDLTLENQYLSLTFDGTTGLLKSAMNIPKKLQIKLEQTLMYYKGFVGDNHDDASQASGAYTFKPNGSDPLHINEMPTLHYVKGSQVQEVRQVYSSWASQVFRLYDNAQYVEVEWTVGPIPIQDSIGKEVISRYSSDMDTKATFYTDANGRQILKRVRDYRPTWKLNQTEEVAGNYYPVNSRIYIQDTEQRMQLTVMTDRSQGGSSIKDGSLELMVHRRLLVDDGFALNEALNETGISGKGLVVRGKHYLLFDTIGASGALHRDLGEKLFMSPSVSYSPLTMSPQDYAKDFKAIWSGMNRSLPDNVHLLTLEQWEDNTILLRLEHFYDKGEDQEMSQPATLSLQTLFNSVKISSVEELALGANAKLSDVKRLQWRSQDGSTSPADLTSAFSPVDDTLTITLEPMQIRTFQVTVM